MQLYRLYTYDLWGNDEDGYEVNDVFRQEQIELDAENMTDHEILIELKAQGIFMCIENIQIDNNICGGETIYFIAKDVYRPICELRLEE